MKNKNILYIASIILFLFCVSCEKNEVLPSDTYDCQFTFNDSSSIHPNSSRYMEILKDNRKNGLVGTILLVKDKKGLWIGSDGYADVASGVKIKQCNRMLIASVSKVFTSAVVYKYIDKGLLALESPIKNYLSAEIIENVKNVDKARIKNLLAHTSGIADYYTTSFELDRLNKYSNKWDKYEVLKYTYNKNPTNDVGETYHYSNTNYLLLSLILENISGKSFESIYRDEIFDPLNLSSAYYSETNKIPKDCPKGYSDFYGNGQFVESQFLYNDELGIGGDGGIAINGYDLLTFFSTLVKGNLISNNSYLEMTNWFELPPDQRFRSGEISQLYNGYGIERYDTQFGYAIGHSGGIDGFISLALYFPEKDMSYIIMSNCQPSSGGLEAYDKIFDSAVRIMFE